MISDGERREVARRLRMSRSEWSGMGWRLWLGIKFGAVVLSDGNRDELEDAARLLADLIEPSCDRDALLELAQEINDTSCDNHGELSVSLGDIWGWSQAIRDALGVSDG